jgi:hypothetical protein
MPDMGSDSFRRAQGRSVIRVVERALAFCQSHFPRVEGDAWRDTAAESRLRFGPLALRQALVDLAKHPISLLLEVLTSELGGYYRRVPVSNDRECPPSVDNTGDTSPYSSARHGNASLTLAEARRGPFQPGAPVDKFLLADSVLHCVGRTRDAANAEARETKPDSERVAPAPDASAPGLPLPDGRARGTSSDGGPRTTERTSS